ncbi:MAG: hypothetical protein SGCHY_002417 [Lobulomycetales sp.]
MFVFLSKKIAIPNNVKISSLAWNNDQGWIAVGGQEGLLKVLCLESPNPKGSGTAVDAPSSNLTMNQTLEGHTRSVVLSTWNSLHRKLTTSDSHGLIIVWILYKGVWYEEMINNRNKSVVNDMTWDREGSRICIAYEDGAVIVGSVDGNRLWGKDLKGCQLQKVQWSPSAKNILFATTNGELLYYDQNGNFSYKVTNYCADSDGKPLLIEGMEWYNGVNGYTEENVPCLAIGFANGRIQIMRDERDTHPIIIDTNMRDIKLKWNNTGTTLAVTGVQTAKNAQGEEKELSIVQFYTAYGDFLRFLKVPGKRISALTWENNGLRIAVGVESFIYFASIRPDHKWCFFASDVIVYVYNRLERAESIVVFWNTKTDDKYVKYISGKIHAVTGYGDYCVVVADTDSSEDQEKR